MKSPIRWAGSKKALLPKLREYWALNSGRYIEPFCGSACFFFDIEPDAAVLGDINEELITTYRCLRRDPERVVECLLRLRPNRQTYYRLRKTDPASLSENELAARFLLLNRLCFNGIYRTNRKGQFNVPFAEPKNKVQFDLSSIRNGAALLRKATLIGGDFEETLSHASHGDFVYLDPPYAVSRRRVFAEYHQDSFSSKDLARLRATLLELDKKGVAFLVSYAHSREGLSLVEGWTAKRTRTRRNVAGFADHRRQAYEILASNLELD